MQCPRCGTNNLDTNVICSNCFEVLRPVGMASADEPAVPPGPSQPRELTSTPVVPAPPPQYVPPASYSPGPDTPARPPETAPAPPQYAPPSSYSPPASTPPADARVPGWYTPPPAAGTGSAQAGAPARPPALPHFGSLATGSGATPYQSVCGVCGSVLFAGQARCLRCQTPPGAILNPNDPTATNYLAFGPPIALVPLFRAGDQQPEISVERIGGWNWAAALMPTAWSARHKLRWLAAVSGALTLLLVGLFLVRAALHNSADGGGTLTGFLVTCALIFGLPRSIYLGLRGNSLAWDSGLYPDRAQLRKSQRSWTLWAIIGVIVIASLLAVAGSLLNARPGP